MKTRMLVFLFCCLASWGHAQPSVPAITLVGEGSRTALLSLSYQNEFQDLVGLTLQPNSLTGAWQPVQLATPQPLVLKLNAQGSQYTLYARPGDTITIRTHPGQTPYYTFHDSQRRPLREAELNFFSALQQAGLGIGFPDATGLTPGAQRARQANRFCLAFDQRLTFLQQAQRTHSLSPAFTDFAAAQLRAHYLQALFGGYWDEQHHFLQYPPTYLQELSTAGAASFLTKDELVRSSDLYRTLVISFVRYLSREVVDTPEELPVAYRLAAEALRGRTRDYAWFYLLKSQLDKRPASWATLLTKFRQDCTTPSYIRYVDSVASRKEAFLLRADLLATPLRSSSGEVLTWAQVMQRNAGKMQYVDLWASWCGPCLAEMPASYRLRQQVQDLPVQFLYVSVDSDADKWRKAMVTHGLEQPGTQHYLLDPTSALAKFFNAPPIPRYLLFDAQGRVLSLDAARPSTPALVNTLGRKP